jgi:hypothetical protein
MHPVSISSKRHMNKRGYGYHVGKPRIPITLGFGACFYFLRDEIGKRQIGRYLAEQGQKWYNRATRRWPE